MNYGAIKKHTIENGSGVNVSFFVSGCRRHCPECHNSELWDFGAGKEYDPIQTANEIVKALTPSYIAGLAILGGEPLEPENVGEIESLCYIVRRLYPNKKITIYTGYDWDEVKDLELWQYVDYAVTGDYRASERVLDQFRGSANQKYIDCKMSLHLGSEVEVETI